MHTRTTFEESYKAVIRDCSIYEVKKNCPSASYGPVREAASADAVKVHDLLDDLCRDMSMVFGRRIERRTELNFRNMTPVGRINWAATYLKEYYQKVPFVVERVTEGLVRKGLPRLLPTGWVRWSGWDAETQMPDDNDILHTIKLPEAEEAKPESYDPLPPHIQKFLKKLQRTKFEYDPYILTGINGEKILAIRLGCQWSDLAIARWTPKSEISNMHMQCGFWLVAFVALLGSIRAACVCESWWFIGLFLFTGVVSLAGVALMSILISDHLRPIRV